MTTGRCSVCGYEPVAFGARACPNCGVRNPNPGVSDRFAGRSMLIGLACGMLVGGAYGYFSKADGMVWAISGALFGAIPGLILGLIVGLILASVAWMMGKR